MSTPTVHVSATPDTPASELGVLRYRLTVLLAHLAVRRPSPEALGDLRQEIAFADVLGPQCLTTWEARR